MSTTYTVHPEIRYVVHRNWSFGGQIGTEIAGEFYSLAAAERASAAMEAAAQDEYKAGGTSVDD